MAAAAQKRPASKAARRRARAGAPALSAIGRRVCAELTRLSRRWGKDIPPPVYKRSDFKEIRTGKGDKGRTGRFIGPGGKEYSRRQVEKLIGNPISDVPAHERDQLFADALLDADFRLCVDFKGTIKSNSGRDHRERNREEDDIEIDPDEQDEELAELVEAWLEGDCDSAGDSLVAGMFESWWGPGRSGEITDVEELAIHICDEREEV